jgi:hypothetical protein
MAPSPKTAAAIERAIEAAICGGCEDVAHRLSAILRLLDNPRHGAATGGDQPHFS